MATSTFTQLLSSAITHSRQMNPVCNDSYMRYVNLKLSHEPPKDSCSYLQAVVFHTVVVIQLLLQEGQVPESLHVGVVQLLQVFLQALILIHVCRPEKHHQLHFFYFFSHGKKKKYPNLEQQQNLQALKKKIKKI